MLVKSENFIHIDHIMWQPQFKCVAGCKGCYIGDSKVSKYNGALNTQILDLLFDSEPKVACKQFTVSLDTLYQTNPELIDALLYVWEAAPEFDIELCVTLQNISSMQRYMHWMKMTRQQFLAPLTVLSLSNMPTQGKECLSLKENCEQANTILNYNKCAFNDKTATSKALGIGARNAHQTYVVLKKEPLGGIQDPEAIKWFLDTYHEADKQGMEVVMDHCVLDSFQSKCKEKSLRRKCGAGITKIAIWPDGSVTGCPYDTNNVQNFQHVDTWKAIVDVVINRTSHPMDHCTIPAAVRDFYSRQEKKADL